MCLVDFSFKGYIVLVNFFKEILCQRDIYIYIIFFQSNATFTLLDVAARDSNEIKKEFLLFRMNVFQRLII